MFPIMDLGDCKSVANSASDCTPLSYLLPDSSLLSSLPPYSPSSSSSSPVYSSSSSSPAASSAESSQSPPSPSSSSSPLSPISSDASDGRFCSPLPLFARSLVPDGHDVCVSKLKLKRFLPPFLKAIRPCHLYPCQSMCTSFISTSASFISKGTVLGRLFI